MTALRHVSNLCLFALLAATALESKPALAGNVASSGLTVTLYQRAIDKAISEAPRLVGPVFNFSKIPNFVANSGGFTSGVCDVGYSLGVRDGQFVANIAPPSSLTVGVGDNGQLSFGVNINGSGSVVPYAEGHFCDLFNPSISPPVSASGIYGTAALRAQITNHQLVISEVGLDAHFRSFTIDLGIFSWLLDQIGWRDGFDAFIRDWLTKALVNDFLPTILPKILTDALRDKINFSQMVSVNPQTSFTFSASPATLTTTAGKSLSISADVSITGSAPGNCQTAGCVEPFWAPTVGRPATDDGTADAALALGIPAFNQALFGLYRAGQLTYHQDLDAATVLGALLPGLTVDGTASVDVSTANAPSLNWASADSQVTDLAVKAPQVVAHVVVNRASQAATPIDLTLTSDFFATAVVAITPPDLPSGPNPKGNQVQFYAKDWRLGTVSLVYGPNSGQLTPEERDALLKQVIIPEYEKRLGVVTVSSSILNFSTPDAPPLLPRRAALRLLRTARVQDALALYVKLDFSPTTVGPAPMMVVDTVDGRAPSPTSREVYVGTHDPIVNYHGTDSNPDFNDYLTYETSMDGATFTARGGLRTLRLLGLPEGTMTFYVRGTSFSGAPSANPTSDAGLQARARLIVDTLPPTTALTLAPSAYTNRANVDLTFSGTDAGVGVMDYVINVDGASVGAPQTVGAVTIGPFTEGAHQIIGQARDRLLHVDPLGVTANFVIDFTPPTTILAAPRTGFVRPSEARFALTSADKLSPPGLAQYSWSLSGPSCTRDFGPFNRQPVADFTSCALADGAYVVSAKSQDAAGNIDPAPPQVPFSVDGTAPVVTLLQHPNDRSTDRELRFSLQASDNLTPLSQLTYAYRLQGFSNDYSSDLVSPNIVLKGVPSGDYHFFAIATDLAGNRSSPAECSFSLDNVAPTTTLSQKIPEWVTTQSLALSATGKDDRTQPAALHFVVVIDRGGEQEFSQPVMIPQLAEGAHGISIKAKDEFGNIDPTGAVAHFSVDRTPPHTEILSSVSRVSTGKFHPKVSGNDNLTAQNDLRYMYRVTRAGLVASDWSTPVLADNFAITLKEPGRVTIEIAAVDLAGLVDATPAIVEADVKGGSGCRVYGDSVAPSWLWGGLVYAAWRRLARRWRMRRVLHDGGECVVSCTTVANASCLARRWRMRRVLHDGGECSCLARRHSPEIARPL